MQAVAFLCLVMCACAPQIYKARWGRSPAAAEFMVPDSAGEKKHHFRNAPMLLTLKHPNVIEFFDCGEIATGEVGTPSIDPGSSAQGACIPVSDAHRHLST